MLSLTPIAGAFSLRIRGKVVGRVLDGNEGRGAVQRLDMLKEVIEAIPVLVDVRLQKAEAVIEIWGHLLVPKDGLNHVVSR